MPEIAIYTEKLTRNFGAVRAVDSLSLEIPQGIVLGFLGHNGAGKTTTVRLLNGVLNPDGGIARVLGLDPSREGPALRRRTGVLTETPSLDERLTARENLTFYAELYDVPAGAVAGRVDELLEFFGLTDRAEDKVGSYSKGMKQRLALARAMIHNPEVLFLDEPTSGLDPESARHVHEMITHVSRARGRTVFLCTHNLVEAQKLCDQVALLEHGRIIASGTPTGLARQIVRHARLEIEIAPEGTPQAVDILRTVSDAAQVRCDEGTLVVTGLDREAVPTLVTALASAGIRIYKVAPQEPSLEDVYFALHGKTGREGTP